MATFSELCSKLNSLFECERTQIVDNQYSTLEIKSKKYQTDDVMTLLDELDVKELGQREDINFFLKKISNCTTYKQNTDMLTVYCKTLVERYVVGGVGYRIHLVIVNPTTQKVTFEDYRFFVDTDGSVVGGGNRFSYEYVDGSLGERDSKSINIVFNNFSELLSPTPLIA